MQFLSCCTLPSGSSDEAHASLSTWSAVQAPNAQLGFLSSQLHALSESVEALKATQELAAAPPATTAAEAAAARRQTVAEAAAASLSARVVEVERLAADLRSAMEGLAMKVGSLSKAVFNLKHEQVGSLSIAVFNLKHEQVGS